MLIRDEVDGFPGEEPQTLSEIIDIIHNNLSIALGIPVEVLRMLRIPFDFCHPYIPEETVIRIREYDQTGPWAELLEYHRQEVDA